MRVSSIFPATISTKMFDGIELTVNGFTMSLLKLEHMADLVARREVSSRPVQVAVDTIDYGMLLLACAIQLEII